MRLTVGLRAKLIRLMKPQAPVSAPASEGVASVPVCSESDCERHGEGSC